MGSTKSDVTVGLVVPTSGEAPQKPRGGPFRPGPDPRRYKGGRPRSGLALAERIRRRVDLDELVDLAIDIARGRAIAVETVDGVKTKQVVIPKTSDRVAALNFLAERGFVKPPTTIAIDQGGKPPIDFGRLTDDQLDQYEQLLAVAAGEKLPIDVAG